MKTKTTEKQIENKIKEGAVYHNSEGHKFTITSIKEDFVSFTRNGTINGLNHTVHSSCPIYIFAENVKVGAFTK